MTTATGILFVAVFVGLIIFAKLRMKSTGSNDPSTSAEPGRGYHVDTDPEDDNRYI